MQRNLKVKPARRSRGAGGDQRLKIKDAACRLGIAVAEYNSDITEKLLAGALKELRAYGVREENITVVRVPGSFELPLACQWLARSGNYDGFIALGAVIKGETDHYYYIAREAAAGIREVMLKYDIPIGFGVLTTDTLKQAQSRATDKNNKGAEAARAVLQMISSVREQD